MTLRGFASGEKNKRRLLAGARLALALLVVVGVLGILSAATYRVPGGEMTLSLRPAWPGGRLVMPLGPAGRVEMLTHRTPVNLDVRFELAARDKLGDLGELARGLPAARASAQEAFTSFILWKMPWIVALGLGVGLLCVGPGPRVLKRGARAAGLGLAGVLVAVGALAGLSYATLDRSPSVSYQGLARDLPLVVSVVRNASSALKGPSLGFGEFVSALETMGKQLASEGPIGVGEDGVRLLLVSDLHANPVGARLAGQLARSRVEPVDAVLLGGDMTYFGTEAEARLVAAAFGDVPVPVLVAGGNHDAAPAMRYFASLGWRILDGEVVDVNGVRVMGFSDPVAWSPMIIPTESEMARAAANAASAWSAASPAPEVVLVHDRAQAEGIIQSAQRGAVQLTVLHGHDHVAAVKSEGTVHLIDGGSAGASGVERLGRDPDTPYTFQLVEYSVGPDATRPVSVTTFSYSGNGSSQAQYQPLG